MHAFLVKVAPYNVMTIRKNLMLISYVKLDHMLYSVIYGTVDWEISIVKKKKIR
jgi:hypothetical protein